MMRIAMLGVLLCLAAAEPAAAQNTRLGDDPEVTHPTNRGGPNGGSRAGIMWQTVTPSETVTAPDLAVRGAPSGSVAEGCRASAVDGHD